MVLGRRLWVRQVQVSYYASYAPKESLRVGYSLGVRRNPEGRTVCARARMALGC